MQGEHLLLVVSLFAIACSGPDQNRDAVDLRRDQRVIGEQLRATPVRSTRAWTTALAPNQRGGWNFITQYYDVTADSPPVFVVVDLETGSAKSYPGPPGIYANSNYQVAEQLRAPNGRIFFPGLRNHIAYYDPASEAVEQLGQVVTSAEDTAIFRAVIGPDGKLYGGTQSKGLPTLFELDPETLTHQVLGKVGDARIGYSYAYYLAVSPPWIYAVVGQNPWELVAFDTRTRKSKVLATVPSDGFIELESRKDEIAAKLVTGLRTPQQTSTSVWCVAGQLSRSPPQATRRKLTTGGTLQPRVSTPEIDLASSVPNAAGITQLRWRARYSTPWRSTSFRTVEPDAIAIDSLVALRDGSLFGSVEQYHGFFRFDPKREMVDRYEGIRISGGPRLVDGTRIYFSGYPKSPLYEYESTRPWDPAATPPNPRRLGSFDAAGAHYPYFLTQSRTGQIYFAGRRERTGTGAAIGSYDPGRNRFAGTHENLVSLTPRGLLVADELRSVVLSTRSDSTSDAMLVVFDDDLREQARLPVLARLRSTGTLYRTEDANVILGVSIEDGIAYLFDLRTRTLVRKRSLPGSVAASAQRESDGSVWLVAGRSVIRLDPASLAPEIKGTLTEATVRDQLVWAGERLYRTRGGSLYEIIFFPSLPTSR